MFGGGGRWKSWRAHLSKRLGGEGSVCNLEWIVDEEVSSLQGLNPWVPTLA